MTGEQPFADPAPFAGSVSVDHTRRMKPGAPPVRSGRLRRAACRGDTASKPSNMRSGADMKVNVEIDCTPLEARQFFGLPDVQPMQTAVMDNLQQQMMANIEKVLPEALMQSWFTFDPKIAERFGDMFVTMAGLGGSRPPTRSNVPTGPHDTPAPTGFARLASACCWRRRGDFRIQCQPVAVAAADAGAQGRRPSGAGAAGFLASDCRWRRCAGISGSSATTPCVGKGPQHSAVWRGCGPSLRDRLAEIMPRPAARSASSVEPRRGLRARSGAAGARHGPLV